MGSGNGNVIPPPKHTFTCGALGSQRRVRDVSGPQAYTYGLIAKQPNSNWQSRFLSTQQRMNEESSKDDEQKKKDNQREIIKSKFHIKTDKKNFEAKIRNRVDQSLQAAEEILNCKRERLRELLLAEEKEYIREYVTKAQKVSDSLYDEQKRKALECKVKQQAEEAALAAEKRLQQYMNRCEELRTFRESLNTKEVAETVLKQIEDKKKQREADIELEKMWHDVAMKNYALMVAYEEEEESKRNKSKEEINTILQNQIKGHQHLKEEENRIKMEERANLDKLRESIHVEEELAKREKELKKQKLYEEMEEVKRQSAELHARRKAQEEVLNDMFCQLIEQELKREQDNVQDNKAQLRKESDLFRAYLKEAEEKRKKSEAEADNVRAREVSKIEAAKHELEVKKCEAILKLKEEVLRERDGQIKAKEMQIFEEHRKLEEEARLAELLRLEGLEVDKEERKALEKRYKEYHMDLARQIEHNKQVLIKQCEEEEQQLKESVRKEEAYFNKVKDIIANKCSSKTHPFLKKLQGMTT